MSGASASGVVLRKEVRELMATKIWDLAVATSKYKDRNGQEKSRWENVGAMWQGKDEQGNDYTFITLKATFNFAALTRRENSDAVRVSLFKPKEKTQQNAQPPQQQTSRSDNFSDGLNFTPEFAPEIDTENIEECPF